jgi:hypothetical protein
MRRKYQVEWRAIALVFLVAFVWWCPKQKRNAVSGPSARTSVAATQVRRPRVAIILCKFRDKPSETREPRFYRDYYTRRGTGGLADYWSDVTFGHLDLSNSEVLGWYSMQHESSEVPKLVFPGGRNTLVQWGKDAAAANGVILSKYDAILVVQNWGIDHGAAGNGVVIVDQNVALLESTFIAHEMGHMFGLPHSFGENVQPCISASGEYCDAWDIMSAMNVFNFSQTFQGVSGSWGSGLNTFNLKLLGALPREREFVIEKPDFSDTFDLAPLNQPLQTGGHYAIEFQRPGASTYTIEYRHKDGWDRALPFDAVLVHEEKSGRSFLKPTVDNSHLRTGQRYDGPTFYAEVVSIDFYSQKATVRVWDLPDHALRQEDSDANYYLIEAGEKRRVTSAAAITRIGRKRSEVRKVPDGALAKLHEGVGVY